MKVKIGAAKVLPVVAALLTVATTIVDHKRQAADRVSLKAELKDELIKDLLSETKE